MNFSISDHIYAEYIIFLKNVTWLNISLLNFARKTVESLTKYMHVIIFPFWHWSWKIELLKKVQKYNNSMVKFT